MKFRKKPVVIEAVQWNGDNLAQLQDWGAPVTILPATDMQSLIVGTLEDGPNCEAVHVATMHDWIIKGVNGEFYPCKPDIFAKTYDDAEPKPIERPTIAELERILQRDDDVEIEILPNGEVRAKDSGAVEKPLTMRESLGGEYA
jgi:hypothetical protein